MAKTNDFNNIQVINLDSIIKRITVYVLKLFANRFRLLNPLNKALPNRVNLNYWDGKPNLGDAISPVIVEHLLSKKGLTLLSPTKKTSHLYAVGSVITAGVQDCTIWGSGILYTLLGYRLKGRKLDVRAVRGPLTRVMLLEYGYNVPEIFGDPAIFLPEVYTPKNVQKKYKYGIVAHKNGSVRLNDFSKLGENCYTIIDIKTCDYKKFIDQLFSAERIISTSLHGIILAESYGIPAILVRPDFSLFKYYDWYCATGRNDFPVLNSLEELSDDIFPQVPDLTSLRIGLLNTFPYDLFE